MLRPYNQAPPSSAGNFSQGANHGGHIGGVLEEADGGDSGGPGGEARGEIIEGDAADGEHGNGDGAADFSKTLQPLRSAIGSF